MGSYWLFEGDEWGLIGGWVKLAVETDRAGIYGSEAYAAGELEWMKDYSPGYTRTQPYTPVTIALDLSKPQGLGEPVELTWSMVSSNDIDKVKALTEFRLWRAGTKENESEVIESDSMLVEGDLQWEGTLKKDIPVYSSAIVKFPEEGDWQIRFVVLDNEGHRINSYRFYLSVTKEGGRWGWAEPHKKKVRPPTPSNPPSPPPTLGESR